MKGTGAGANRRVSIQLITLAGGQQTIRLAMASGDCDALTPTPIIARPPAPAHCCETAQVAREPGSHPACRDRPYAVGDQRDPERYRRKQEHLLGHAPG